MILGVVNSTREAVIQIAIVGEQKQLKSLPAIIDTGYTGDLTMPKSIILELGWLRLGVQEAILGDGSSHDFEVYAGMIIWDGNFKRVEVNASTNGSLIGIGLVEGWKLEIEAKAGGDVKLTQLRIV